MVRSDRRLCSQEVRLGANRISAKSVYVAGAESRSFLISQIIAHSYMLTVRIQ